MLSELHIENLGVIDTLDLQLGNGLVALTGETGAGKTMIVEAINLLVGGRADAGMIRPGATEARVEGRFVVGEEEMILCRTIPARWSFSCVCQRPTCNRFAIVRDRCRPG